MTGIQGPAGTGITTAIRKTWTVIGTGLQDVAFGHGLSGVEAYPVTPGEVYTFSSYWRVSRSQNSVYTSRYVVVYYDSSGATISDIAGSNYTGPIVADEWNRGSITVMVPEGVSFMTSYVNVLFMDNTSLQVGDTLDATGLLVEKSSVIGPYFDGSYSPDPDLTPSWTGTANESPSILTGQKVTSFFVTSAAKAQYRSAKHGVALVPISPSSGDSALYILGQNFGAGVSRLLPGKWYAAKLAIYIDSPITKTHLNSLSLIAEYDSTTTWSNNTQILAKDSIVENISGEHTVTITFQVPTDVEKPMVWIRAYNGSKIPTDIVYFNNILIAQADTEEEALRLVQAPYRDGDSPGWTWDGMPGLSASRGLS